jgi:hypothetical protein
MFSFRTSAASFFIRLLRIILGFPSFLTLARNGIHGMDSVDSMADHSKEGRRMRKEISDLGLFALTTVSWVAILSAVVVIVRELVR